jgi:excinuclease ABC subunit C
VVAFIEGRNQALLDDLTARMQTLAGQRQFEEAAALRDQIRSIANFQSRQKVAGDPGDERDLVAVVSDGAGACGVVFDVRDGKIVNRRHFWIDHAIDAPETEVLSGFLKQYYLIADFVPAEIDVPLELEERAGIEAWLSSRRGAPVRLVAPSDAKRTALLDMCGTNARLLLNEFHEQKAMSGDWIAPSVAALQKDLGLTEPPKRIEAFDISNLAGQDAVASMVAFENGKPFKSGYRKFKIRRIEGIDDFAMMAEVVERRVSRLLKEGKEMPDLILVDGGKGQLSAALEALRKCGVENQPVVGLAKRLEEIFRPGLSDPQTLPKSSPSLRLLQHVRDEAHRFAVAFHRSLRGKRAVASVLDSVPGIGAARRSALLSHFGSVDAIRAASVDAIAAVEGMSRKTAERVKEALDAGKPPNSAGAGR